jgi:hydroxymethylpyrimidine pyrophosphatase-like HAD family hydrolase
MNPNRQKTIAVDFDGTIVEHRFPKIGDEMVFAFESLRFLQGKGHRLILWTYRSGRLLDEAVAYCRENGIEFYAINKNFPEEHFAEGETSRKIKADIYIDDRNVGGFPGWGEVVRMIHPEMGEYQHQLVNKEAHRNYKKLKKRSIWDFFKV